MMANNYKIEKINYEGIDKIIRLYTLCFGRIKDANFFKWKYFDNPAGEALCLAANYDGNTIGSCVMIPEEFYVFGKKMKIYKCCDLMVAPEYRKKGVSSKLVFSLIDQLRQAGHLFLYTLCGKNATPSFRKNKWLKLDDVRYYFKHRNQYRVKFLFNEFERLYTEGILRQIDPHIDLCKNYNFKIDVNKIRNVRDERFLRWRLKNPYNKYNSVGYYEKDVLKGYVIYNAGINNNIYLIDLEADNEDLEIIKTLLAAVEFAACKSNRRLIIVLAVKDTGLERLIKNNGYLINPFSRGPLTSLLDFNILIDETYGNEVFSKSKWDISGLNYDDI